MTVREVDGEDRSSCLSRASLMRFRSMGVTSNLEEPVPTPPSAGRSRCIAAGRRDEKGKERRLNLWKKHTQKEENGEKKRELLKGIWKKREERVKKKKKKKKHYVEKWCVGVLSSSLMDSQNLNEEWQRDTERATIKSIKFAIRLTINRQRQLAPFFLFLLFFFWVNYWKYLHELK